MLEKNDAEFNAIAVIYSTQKYDMFRRLEENRSVLENRVTKLTASIAEKNILNPIIVNENMEIIDGQGRYEALKRLGLPVAFIVEPGLNNVDCSRLNKYNTKWTLVDFVESWAKCNNEFVSQNYQNLIDAKNKTKLSLNNLIRLANRNASQKDETIKDGRLVFTNDDFSKVIKRWNVGNEIKTALCYDTKLNSAFWTSIAIIDDFKEYNHERMLKNCEYNRHSYKQMSKLEDQLKEMSRIYNYKAKTSKLFFEDYMRNRGYNIRSYEHNSFTIDHTDISTLNRNQ